MAVSDTLSSFFGFEEYGTDLRTEVVAGLTTFLTMSYIVVVNPATLSVPITPEGGDPGRTFQMLAVVTIVASVVVMALYANWPFGLAPGMGLNAFLVTVVLSPTLGVSWQVALAAVFVEGLVVIGLTVGGMIGTSTVTTYIESSTGIEEGGRTGMTAAVVAGLFLVALAVVPLLSAIPSFAPYVAFLIVAVFMFRGVTDIDWGDNTEAIPATLTIGLLPFTASIATGIAAGLLSYPVVKTAAGEFEDVRLGQWVLAALVVGYYFVRTNTLV